MADSATHVLLSSLKNMLQYCRNIRQLLDDDKAHFANNALTPVVESNQNKMLMLEKLTSLTNEMNAQIAPGGNFLHALEINTGNYSADQQNEIMPLVKELKTEITEAYQLLTINNDIVLSNLQQISLIWEKLIALRAKAEGLYDNTGSIGA